MLKIICSTIADDSMKSLDQSFSSVLPHRHVFLEKNDTSPTDTTLVQLVYEGDDYARYRTISSHDKGDGITRPATIVSDALVVTKPGHTLFLPLADCVGAVIHDPTKGIMMLSHLGRHNLEQFGGSRSIDYLVKEHGCNPSDLTAWLSPAAGKDHYPLYSFDNRGMHEVATEQLIEAGVLREHITASPIDSAADTHYYSHSQFLQGKRPDDGRFAIVAMMNSVLGDIASSEENDRGYK